MDIQVNRKRIGTGTGPVFRNCGGGVKPNQLPQPPRMIVLSGSNDITNSNIPFLVQQINVGEIDYFSLWECWFFTLIWLLSCLLL
jgi:hypothetical protein